MRTINGKKGLIYLNLVKIDQADEAAVGRNIGQGCASAREPEAEHLVDSSIVAKWMMRGLALF
jgi:hypothetical protein